MEEKEQRRDDGQFCIVHEDGKEVVHGVVLVFHGIFDVLSVGGDVGVDEAVRLMVEGVCKLEMR